MITAQAYCQLPLSGNGIPFRWWYLPIWAERFWL